MSSQSTPGVASTPSGADGVEPTDTAAITPVGVDVGTRQLVAVASAGADPADATVVDGDRARDLYGAYTRATHRLRRREHTGDSLGAVVWRYWRRLRREFRAAADAVLSVARRHAEPVVVLEDLPGDRQPLVAAQHGQVRAPVWIPPSVQAVVADRAVDAGVPVAYVSPRYTTKECHACGLFASDEGETIVCTTPDCPVGEVCRDRSAAVSIAKRLE